MGRERYQQLHFEFCEMCGKPFLTARKHAKTCSAKCRKAKSRVGQKLKQEKIGVTFQELQALYERYGVDPNFYLP